MKKIMTGVLLGSLVLGITGCAESAPEPATEAQISALVTANKAEWIATMNSHMDCVENWALHKKAKVAEECTKAINSLDAGLPNLVAELEQTVIPSALESKIDKLLTAIKPITKASYSSLCGAANFPDVAKSGCSDHIVSRVTTYDSFKRALGTW